ncbi:hypothetical protein L596_023535 [Steinernema carpocapsae]|uniref:Uncharacterized protein n=1 Tax=Steinernema carpocapsae TaxID=34508 RepID=A0A4U5MEQ8_STECR|nr:hypothetical protein L596_023535 [Steinernema carpocapsae]
MRVSDSTCMCLGRELDLQTFDTLKSFTNKAETPVKFLITTSKMYPILTSFVKSVSRFEWINLGECLNSNKVMSRAIEMQKVQEVVLRNMNVAEVLLSSIATFIFSCNLKAIQIDGSMKSEIL